MLLRNGYTKAVDWWSLGALLFEMLAGKPPFVMKKGESQKDLDKKIISNKPSIPSYLQASTVSLLKGLLEKDMNKRLGSTTHSTKGGRGIGNTNMDVNGRFDYSSSHIKAIAVHPGYTATALQHGAIPLSEWNNYLFGMTVHDGSMSQLRAATDPEAAPSGSVDSMLGPALGGWGPAWFSIPTLSP